MVGRGAGGGVNEWEGGNVGVVMDQSLIRKQLLLLKTFKVVQTHVWR